MRQKTGFTLVELLVAIAIIGVLISGVTIAFNNAREKGRDTKRKQDLLSVKAALTLYFQDNGAYPYDSANPATTSFNSASSQPWIPGGLVPTYIKQLPVDPKQLSNNILNRLANATTELAGLFGFGNKSVSGQVAAATVITFTTPGINDWVCPDGVSSVQIELWGAGGGGGGGSATSGSGGGGGGGAYSKKNAFVCTSGDPHTIYVGNKGAGGSGSTNGVAGEDSYFDDTSTVLAKGGARGNRGASGESGSKGNGGAAASGVGDTKNSGGNGATGAFGIPGASGGGGGGAGDANVGGNASGSTKGTGGSAGGGNGGNGASDAAGSVGTQPGGGGGGGDASFFSSMAGAAGANGKAILTWTIPSTPTPTPIPQDNISPWTAVDIGSPLAGGQAKISDGNYDLYGDGADIWFGSDSFRLAYQQQGGDFTITAQVTGFDNTDPWAKAGVMARSSTSAGAAYILMMVTPSTNGMDLQYRKADGGSAQNDGQSSSSAIPKWLRLTKTGSTITAYSSNDGTTFTQYGVSHNDIGLGATPLVGFAVNSHNTSVLAKAQFRNVTITVPATPTPTPTPTPPATPIPTPKPVSLGRYSYAVAADRQSFTLWASLENISDSDISTCGETPPEPGYNYCLKQE